MEAAPHSVPWRAVAAAHPCSHGATWVKRKIQQPTGSVRQGSSSQEKHLQPHTSLNIYRLCSLIKLVLVGKLKTILNSLTKGLGFYASKTREFSFLSKALKKFSLFLKEFLFHTWEQMKLKIGSEHRVEYSLWVRTLIKGATSLKFHMGLYRS